MARSPSRHIVFFHPDLGIGGAERLVVDAAVGLQKRGHRVTIFTSHCDPKHCFEEARDGTLDVRVRGNNVVPPYILGRFAIVCAILRQLHVLVQISLSGELARLRADVFFVDQLSACIPLLRWLQSRAPILFYCHFPDKLLAQRRGLVKRLYRIPFDRLEEWTTGAADGLVVNSRFTRLHFEKAFPRLSARRPAVVYPCVDTRVEKDASAGAGAGATDGKNLDKHALLWKGKKLVLSINRFERKKGVELAIKAFAAIRPEARGDARLVVAGGYDPRVQENVGYHRDLVQLAESLGLRVATIKNMVTALRVSSEVEVLFLLSIPASFKDLLLRSARLLVYTPADEHFGIVPLEAMLKGVPVLAANSGGPLESVVEGETGWLRDADDPTQWTAVVARALSRASDVDMHRMSQNGPRRVATEFSRDKMAERLEAEMQAIGRQARPSLVVPLAVSFLGVVGLLGVALAWGTPSLWGG